MKLEPINIPLLLFVGLAIGLLGFFGFSRLQINTDVLASLPIKEQVIFDAREIFTNHPIHDQIAVDLMIEVDAPDILVESATFLEEKMAASGLFDPSAKTTVGALLPQLSLQVVNDLPLLFTGEDLAREVAPRLQREAIRQRLGDLVEGIGGLESIGQAPFIGSDPLGLKDLVLARMIDLAPTSQASFYRGNLLSEDGRHLLLTARPKAAGTDTAAARQLAELFTDAARELSQQQPAGIEVKVTPVGAYRAALDNEEIIRHDVQLALLVSTVGIALLLLLAFPRPLYGVLSLLPSLAGTAAALFVYSLLHSSISIMVLGFGGALLAITVDHGIAYLLFLDRPHTTYGKEVAREVRSIGSVMALFTSIGAFLVLGMSDFPIFTELGQFAALGFLFTFLFIHLIFPKIIPVMPPAKRRTPLLHTVAGRIFSAGKPGAVAAILLAGFLLLFAKPEFRINLSDMNTVSGGTQAADAHFAEVWGDIGAKVYLMTTAANTAALQEQNDRLLRELSGGRESGLIGSFFSPSMIFPGEEQGRANLQAWREFWTAARVAQLETDLHSAGSLLGFTAEAFSPFISQLTPALSRTASPLPVQYGDLLGITTSENGDLVQFISITPGENYAAALFQEEYGGFGKIFDPGYFSSRLAEILFSTFLTLLLIITGMVVLLVFCQLLCWRLTLITLTPILFAYICTLGTLKLLDHPLDIPSLMLSVVILGIGIDYSIYIARSCQWFGTLNHPSHILVRVMVCLAGSSTLIGFGVLCFAEHAILRSLGVTSLCGIGFTLLGTVLLLPPLLEVYFRPGKPADRSAPLEQRILARYRLLEAYPRMFARFKLKFDPMFGELPDILAKHRGIQRILDIGCGYGVPACWCLEYLPKAEIIGVDPNRQRVRVAGLAIGDRGVVLHGAAPALPEIAGTFDAILLLDFLHYLDDRQLAETLARCDGLLRPGGLLITRFVIRPEGRGSFSWLVEEFRVRLAGMATHYRQPEKMGKMMKGFDRLTLSLTSNKELLWLVGQKNEDL
jgi:uncharacterized protein